MPTLDREEWLEIASDLEAIKRLRASNPTKAKELAAIAADFMHESGMTRLDALSAFVERVLVNFADQRQEAPTLRASPTLEDLISSEYLINGIAQQVSEVRQKLFGSSQAPFSNRSDAVKWIRQTAKAEGAKWAGKSVDVSEYERMAQEAKVKIEELEGYRVNFDKNRPSLKYVKKDGSFQSLDIYANTSLDYLSREITGMSRMTGFRQEALTMYVLTDTKPILHRFLLVTELRTYSMKSGYYFKESHADLQVRAKDLTFSELREIYHYIRGHLGLKKAKPLSGLDYQLYDLVRNRGGPIAGRGSVAFWKSIQAEWNRTTESDYQSWKGVKKRYEQITDKLAKRHGRESPITHIII